MIFSYRRCSLDDMHHGPAAQADAIARWAASRSTELVGGDKIERDFFDNGVSGSIPLGKRPNGAKMLAIAREGDTVVVSKLDRLFRSVADAALTIEEWNRKGITLVSLTEGFDLTSCYGKAMAHVMSAMAELERSIIRERTKAALQGKKRRGERVGTVPFGWDAVGGMLVENAREQVALAEIKAGRACGLTLRQIAKKLNSDGVPAKRGGVWQPQAVASVLRRNGG